MKILTIIAALALTASVSSCAKVHTCTCVGNGDSSSSEMITGPGGHVPSKRVAKLECEEVNQWPGYSCTFD